MRIYYTVSGNIVGSAKEFGINDIAWTHLPQEGKWQVKLGWITLELTDEEFARLLDAATINYGLEQVKGVQ